MLTPKQEKFVLHYHQHGNAYRAYEAAGYSMKGKRATIDRTAKTYLEKPMIAARLAELRAEAQKQAQYTVQDAIRELNEAIELAKIANPKTRQVQSATIVQAVQAKIKLMGLEANTSDTSVTIHISGSQD